MRRSVSIDEDLYQSCRAIARNNGISVRGYIQGLLERSLGMEQAEAAGSYELTEKVQTLLLMAVKTVGLPDVVTPMSYIEEQLTLDEADMVEGFLAWVLEDRVRRAFGQANISFRVQEWAEARRKKFLSQVD